MATFRILHTRKTVTPEMAFFEVRFLNSQFLPGDQFLTYDTHHPVQWKVLAVRSQGPDTLLECSTPLGLGWDDQFTGAIVNTEATSRTE